MILSFKPKFIPLIQQGKKIHTIREGNRWHEGMKIHFWKGSPRNQSAQPFQFGTGIALTIEDISIVNLRDETETLIVQVGGSQLTQKEVEMLAINDGLTVEEFRNWFVPTPHPLSKKDFSGQIIHWTDSSYEKKFINRYENTFLPLAGSPTPETITHFVIVQMMNFRKNREFFRIAAVWGDYEKREGFFLPGEFFDEDAADIVARDLMPNFPMSKDQIIENIKARNTMYQAFENIAPEVAPS
jgi:hypothetical protein